MLEIRIGLEMCGTGATVGFSIEQEFSIMIASDEPFHQMTIE